MLETLMKDYSIRLTTLIEMYEKLNKELIIDIINDKHNDMLYNQMNDILARMQVVSLLKNNLKKLMEE